MNNDIRQLFPILNQHINSKPWIYLDNAATTHKPRFVIDALTQYYQQFNSNIHRGAHYMAHLATEKYESARAKLASFIGAKPHEINFSSGTTESINILMQSYARIHLRAGDVVVLTQMEHHANIVPWLYLRDQIGIELRYIPIDSDQSLDIANIDQIIDSRVKLVSLAYISNALGVIHPVQDIITRAQSVGALVHLDLAQAIAHKPIDVVALGIDFASFSAHKMYGPTGIGIFWARESLLLDMAPNHYGGEMIQEVFLDRFTVNQLPFKFEAGTPDIAGVIAWAAALDWIQQIGWDTITSYESQCYNLMYEILEDIPGIILYSPKGKSIGALSFGLAGAHPYDIGQMLDAQGIAIRTGHHCCQPLMRSLGIEGTARASLAIYNTLDEIEQLGLSLKRVSKALA